MFRMIPPRLLLSFQSTAPVWGPTVQVFGLLEVPGISIHGPRVGADKGGRGNHMD